MQACIFVGLSALLYNGYIHYILMIFMHMKLPITDKFLWDLYCILEKTDNVVDFILSNKYKQASILTRNQNPLIGKYRKEIGRRKFSKLIHYLKAKNYIKVEGLKNKKAVMITKNGLSKAFRVSFKIEDKKKRKDGKWVMIIFDIPEKHRKARNMLKSILHNLEYKLLQQSVWATPYDVLEKTEKLIQLHSLDKYVKIFLIEKI